MATIPEALAIALSHHQAGRLETAEQIYRQILQAVPGQADALHLLGVIAHQRGQNAVAVQYIGQATERAPLVADYHSNLGLAYSALGDLDAAAASHRRAIQLRPAYAEAHNNLGSVLKTQGRADEAVACYRQALALRPNYAETSYNLGNVLHEQGRSEEALACYRRALELRPDFAAVHNNLGNVLLDQGKREEALACYRRALQVQPDYVEAQNNLGNAAQAAGDNEQAAAWYRQAIRIRPDYHDAHYNLARALQAQGALDESIACCGRALELRPEHAETYQVLGNAQMTLGRREEAIASFRRALELRPGWAEVHNDLGLALKDQGRLDESLAELRQALALRPDWAMAHNNLGVTLHQQGFRAAAAECYRRVMQLQPDFAEAYHNLATLLHDQWKLDEAAVYYQQCLGLKPDCVEARATLGDVFAHQGKFAEAVDCYDRAAAIRPSNRLRYQKATCLPMIYRSAEHVDSARRQFVEDLDALARDGVRFDPRKDVLNTVFFLVYQGLDDRSIHESIARLWLDGAAGPAAPPPRRRREGEKIRVGFLSRYFMDHTIGELWRGIIAQLSRQRFSVSVLTFARNRDPVSDFIRSHADHYCELPANVPAARQAIAAADLDLLFYTDVGMDPLTYTLACSRLAPVQCTTWGHPVTTGLPSMDYYISSELLEGVDAPRHYTEQLVRLKTLGLYVYRPEAPPPRKSRADFGLPEDRHLYGCLQSLFKFLPDYDPLLAAILRRDPQGLLLVPEGTCSHWKDLLLERFCRVMPDVVPRIHWLPWQDHADYLRLHAVLDVLLVPPQFGGGKTSYEALALGVPVVTLPSPLLRGRITHGMYRAMQVLDCVAGTPEEYVEIALRLGTDADYRRAVGEKIRAAAGRLFEDLEAVRELERFFEAAVAGAAN